MALKWVNIRTGEKVVAETEEQIAALWASSDHSPNITQGQDFGWRLSPEVAVELKRIKQDLGKLEQIASRVRVPFEDLKEYDILHYISNRTRLEEAPQPETDQFQDDYDNEIRQLTREGDDKVKDLFDTTKEEVDHAVDASKMSTEELLAEVERRKASEAAKTTTSTSTTSTTSTTTVK